MQQIRDGIFITEATRKLTPDPSKILEYTFQNTLDHAEYEEIAAALTHLGNRHGKWVAVSYPVLENEIARSYILVLARTTKERGFTVNPEIDADLEKGDFYPALALGMRIKTEGSQSLRDELEEMARSGYLNLVDGSKSDVYQVSQGLLDTLTQSHTKPKLD